jgi:hypothetical protein
MDWRSRRRVHKNNREVDISVGFSGRASIRSGRGWLSSRDVGKMGNNMNSGN